MSSESTNSDSDSTDDEYFSAPFPTQTDDDDDEPPAVGAVTVEFDPGPDVSLAPTAEPNNSVDPAKTPVVA